MLNVILLSVVMLSVIMLSVVMLNFVKLNIVMLSVEAPQWPLDASKCFQNGLAYSTLLL
jgi:hypothetical protein